MSMPVRLLLLIFVALLGACAAPAISPPAPTVDPAQSVIFHNGVILTMLPDQPSVEAMALAGEKIAAIGSNGDILALQTEASTVIDLGGRALMPGFVDAHTHVLNDARADGRSLDQAQDLALRNGITTLGDLYVDEPFLREMRAFEASGALRVRSSLYLVANSNCGQPQGQWYERYPPTRQPGERLRIGGIKIFTDGGSCGGVALSFELAPGQGQGDLWLTQEELNKLVAEAQAAGYQAAIHAIGDRAVAQAQEAVAQALAGGPNIYRHRLEHVSVLRPEFVPRFGELGLIPVLNGQYPACTPFGPPVPAEFRAWEWPWRALRDTNPTLPIAWHSDYPFLSINPFVHLYGFVTRTDVYQAHTCRPAEELRDDTLTVAEALSIMTIESAYALFREEEVGSLAPGKYADVIVLSGNPLTTPEAELKNLTVLATLVGGRYEYCRTPNSDPCPGYQARRPTPLPDLRPPVPVRWLVLGLVALLPLGAALAAWRWPGQRGLLRLAGVAGVLGGLLWAWLWVWADQNVTGDAYAALTWPQLAATTLLALAGVGLAGAQPPAQPPTRPGLAGVAMAVLGMVSVAAGVLLGDWFQTDYGWLLLIFGVLGHAIGLVVFGLANLLARRRSLRLVLPLAVGLLGGVFPLVLSSFAGETTWPTLIMGGGLGLGWALLGLLNVTSSRAAA